MSNSRLIEGSDKAPAGQAWRPHRTTGTQSAPQRQALSRRAIQPATQHIVCYRLEALNPDSD